ncbi:hypothetical protein F2Q68_00024183 [Brassica cretica]|uniref:Uncharacterized protein n=1 Tax=Brassica cretica TaxID=69181 RepID=A0A8S9IA73_BRACR|nr:hypothetical protein F2Q68_00024183 [Brassica cretica]
MFGNTKENIAVHNNAGKKTPATLRLWPTPMQTPQFLRKLKTLLRLFTTGSTMKRALDFSF